MGITLRKPAIGLMFLSYIHYTATFLCRLSVGLV